MFHPAFVALVLLSALHFLLQRQDGKFMYFEVVIKNVLFYLYGAEL
jgi:hypothetical protein